MPFFGDDVARTAFITKCGKYRYYLSRVWRKGDPMLVFIGLNPSTADAEKDDATIRWLMGYARNDFGGLVVVNLFGWRATHPKDMLASKHPIQVPGTSDNDVAILEASRAVKGSMVLCGWGTNGSFLSRDRAVLNLLRRHFITPYALAFNQDGSPHHPLRLPHSSLMREIPKEA